MNPPHTLEVPAGEQHAAGAVVVLADNAGRPHVAVVEEPSSPEAPGWATLVGAFEFDKDPAEFIPVDSRVYWSAAQGLATAAPTTGGAPNLPLGVAIAHARAGDAGLRVLMDQPRLSLTAN